MSTEITKPIMLDETGQAIVEAIENHLSVRNALLSNIADVETDLLSSSKNYNVGEQFFYDNTLYEVIAPISLGDPLILNSNYELADTITEQIGAVKQRVDDMENRIMYGFHIDGNESDPSAMVTYIADAVGMTPAHMDYTNNVFDYGSWENAFFMPRPCMVKYDGTVDYYLDPNDYSKKEDGVTASDIDNANYGCNAMMEWGRDGRKIWYKVVPQDGGKSADIYIANYQADAGFHDWSFHNAHSVSVPHFYTPIYNGSLIDGKLRSLSGKQVSKSLTGTQEIEYAKANNPSS